MLEDAIELLLQHCAIDSLKEEWGEESITLEREEIDTDLLPSSIDLPNQVLANTYIYRNGNNQFIVYILTTVDATRSIAKGILRNNLVVWTEGGGLDDG